MSTRVHCLIFFLIGSGCRPAVYPIDQLILISANAEWKVARAVYPQADYHPTPWGEYFETDLSVNDVTNHLVFFHGGWGKIAAAGSAQYAIDRWHPLTIINLGTCGGFEGDTRAGQTILVDKTIVYDIEEAMGDSRQAIDDYTTTLDLSWLAPVDTALATRSLLVSADRDIRPADVARLREQYHAIAGDWETGAIAYTCARNGQRLLILRGVSDVVGPVSGSVTYGNEQAFIEGADKVMRKLLGELPEWVGKCGGSGNR